MENRNEGGSYYLVHSYTWDTGEKVDTSGKEWGISRHEYRTRKETRESERILSAKTDEEALLEAGEIVKKRRQS